MHKSDITAAALTALCVLGLVLYRLLWAASQIAATDGLGRLPKLPKSWRRWLFGGDNTTIGERQI
jgi:hypothetical protein